MNNLTIIKNNEKGNKTAIILPSGICGEEYMIILNSMKDKIKKLNMIY